jgi:hypothetical protein
VPFPRYGDAELHRVDNDGPSELGWTPESFNSFEDGAFNEIAFGQALVLLSQLDNGAG